MCTFVGIDGGGSTLRVVLVDESLNIIARATGSAVNPNAVGKMAASTQLKHTITHALHAASLHANDICAVGCGIAGDPNNLDVRWIKEAILECVPGTTVIVRSDQEIALVGAHGRPYGMILLAGTGSLAYGIDAHGNHALVGGWGYLSGDEGSGYWIGNEGLRRVFQQADGRRFDTKSDFSERVLSSTQHADVWQLLQWRYQSATTADVARLARVVLTAADAGDPIARDIVQLAVEHLVQHLMTLEQRLSIPREHLAFTGSLIEHDNMLTRLLLQRLKMSRIPQKRFEPVMGAVLLAMEAHGIYT